MAARLPAGAADGQSWVAVVEAADEAKFGTKRTHAASDPRFLLRVLTEYRSVFSGAMSRADSAIASELRQTGNDWAHNTSFNPDDTYRALDSMERLLIAAGAPDPAEGVRTLRMDHQRAVYEAETKKTVKAAGQAGVPGTGLCSPATTTLRSSPPTSTASPWGRGRGRTSSPSSSSAAPT